MEFGHTDEQIMLRDTVRSFVADKAPMTAVREWMESDAGYDRDLWNAMCEIGLAAMHIPEEHGGAGFSFRELGIVFEELGRGVTPSPMLATVALGANLLLLAGSDEQQAALLPSVATGETTLAVAIEEGVSGWDPTGFKTTVSAHDGSLVLNGAKSYVVDGHTADVIIVAARDGAGGVRFVVVPAATPGVATERLESMDMTRSLATVEFKDVRVPASAELADGGADTLERLADLAATALAYEQVGGAQYSMETAVEYAKTRHQFGRPIGSFQAVKHACADMLVAVESARSAAYAAGWAADHDSAEFAILAPLARTVCSGAYFDVTAAAIQVFGGIGFTWEHDAHLFFKRAKSSELLLGSSAMWRSRLGDRLGV